MNVQLYEHQKKALKETESFNQVGYFLDMGLGKTFVGSEKMARLGTSYNLLICQKSKIDDWQEHFEKYYQYEVIIYNKPRNIPPNSVVIINYELAWRRPELSHLRNFTLMLDESSQIKDDRRKKSKFILRNLSPTNVILLSGTPTGGKYEELWSQCRLLGWNISKKAFYEQYIITHTIEVGGFPIEIVVGYKNVERLKRKLREHGSIFMKTEEVWDLPKQVDNVITVSSTPVYRKFLKHRIIEVDGKKLIGDTTLTNTLCERQLCGQFNPYKLTALQDLLESTNERIIIFYNFNAEYNIIKKMCQKLNKPVSTINGSKKDLSEFKAKSNAVVIAQYQAGAHGLNLQLARRIVYFTLPLSSELFEQSKKRIHRIGQERTCFYYYLLVENSIEDNIWRTLAKRKDYTDRLFEEDGVK